LFGGTRFAAVEKKGVVAPVLLEEKKVGGKRGRGGSLHRENPPTGKEGASFHISRKKREYNAIDGQGAGQKRLLFRLEGGKKESPNSISTEEEKKTRSTAPEKGGKAMTPGRNPEGKRVRRHLRWRGWQRLYKKEFPEKKFFTSVLQGWLWCADGRLPRRAKRVGPSAKKRGSASRGEKKNPATKGGADGKCVSTAEAIHKGRKITDKGRKKIIKKETIHSL